MDVMEGNQLWQATEPQPSQLAGIIPELVRLDPLVRRPDPRTNQANGILNGHPCNRCIEAQARKLQRPLSEFRPFGPASVPM